MDYEKKYREALERAKNLYENTNGMILKKWVEQVFPELKESEDEWMMNQLHSWMKEFGGAEEYTEKVYQWIKGLLKKQSEQKPAEWHRADEQNLNACLGFIPDEYLRRWLKDVIHVKYDKTADKVEPKFKVGDWIISRYMHLVMQIMTNDNGFYKTAEIDGTEINDNYDFIERNFKLWTLQDAKNGDVLAFDDDTIVLFKDLYNKTSFHSYCHIEDGVFTVSEKDVPDWWQGEAFYPATKEQRNLLYLKMDEAGYEWDDENKKVKKIEQNPNYCHHAVDLSNCSEEYRKAYYDGWNNCNQQHSQLKAEQKPAAWSKEDEDILNTIIYTVKNKNCIGVPNEIMVNWLKSIKNKYTWKPNEKQMNAIDSTLQYGEVSQDSYEHLNSLFNDLKKLKVE